MATFHEKCAEAADHVVGEFSVERTDAGRSRVFINGLGSHIELTDYYEHVGWRLMCTRSDSVLAVGESGVSSDDIASVLRRIEPRKKAA